MNQRAPARRLGRSPGLAIGPLQLAGHLVERAPHDLVGLEQPFPTGPQLLDLDHRDLPPAGEVAEDPLSRPLRGVDRDLSLGLSMGPDRLGLLAGRVAHSLASLPAASVIRAAWASASAVRWPSTVSASPRMAAAWSWPSFRIRAALSSALVLMSAAAAWALRRMLAVSSPTAAISVFSSKDGWAARSSASRQGPLECRLPVAHGPQLIGDLGQERLHLPGFEPPAGGQEASLLDQLGGERGLTGA